MVHDQSQPSHTLIAFASRWGSKYGGINAFNADLLTAMGIAYEGKLQVICVVNEVVDGDIAAAQNSQVTLLPLPYTAAAPHMDADHAQVAISQLAQQSIAFDPATTLWLGHDRITGAAAIAAAQQAGGQSGLIHHMSYDHYESFAENAQLADDKREQQETLFSQADILMAVGPLLRDALEDRVDGQTVHMIIPGLAEIEPKEKPPNTFSLFVSGRLNQDASKVKQSQLAVAAFASCCKQADDHGHPDALLEQPKLLLRGVDFDLDSDSTHYSSSEQNLKVFAEGYAGGVINLQPLPYTTDRERLFKDLKTASAAAMPSWHEGFGLVAWEAIAAAVPLILSENSGVYKLLKQQPDGFEHDLVWPVKVKGSTADPYFSDRDLTEVSNAINQIAKNPDQARKKAQRLRQELLGYSWAKCAEDITGFFGWSLVKGRSALNPSASQIPAAQAPKNSSQAEPVVIPGFAIPSATFDINSGTALSLLLRASEAVVPFDPLHQPALNQLIDWANNTTYPLSLRLHTGEGGLGKTRLATELCLQLKDQDWQTGLLAKDQSTAQLTQLWQQLQLSQQPCLMVVDYAETQTTELLTLIKLIQASTGSGQKVCLLLLARSGGEWWDNLASSEPQIEGLLTGPATTGPYEVKPLYHSLADRQQGFTLALKAFAKVLGLAVPSTIPDLTPDHFDKPLYIQMAALLLLQGEQPKTTDGIHQALLNHEQRYWHAALKQTTLQQSASTSSMPRKLLALVTLAGHFATAKEAQKYWQIVDDTAISGQSFKQLFDCLTPLYPASQGLQAIKPDILGEALVAEQLTKPHGDNLLTAVLGQGASAQVKSHALTVLGRLSLYQPAIETLLIDAFSQHLAHISQQLVTVAKATRSRLPQWAAEALSQLQANRQNAIAGQLTKLITNDSVALNVVGCEVKKIIYEKAQKKASNKPKDIHLQAEFARTAYNYAAFLSFIGNSQTATSTAKQALDIYEKLAQQQPDRYEPDYAASLHNYATCLNDLGQHQTAANTTKQALDIYARLAEQQPDRYEPDYAFSLSSYANRLSDLGQHQAAASTAKQVLDSYTRLAQQQPDRYESDYAASLHNYACYLSDLGQHQAAVNIAKQVLEIRERLAQQQPDRYQADYANSLSHYANDLSELDQHQAAANAAKHALDIFGRLTQQSPEHYEPAFAHSLNRYGHFLSQLDQHQAAVVFFKQALDIYERLVEQDPISFKSEYENALAHYVAYIKQYPASSIHLNRVVVKGFKSIQQLDLPMNPVNILIGANGAGKTNFISLFTFLRHLSAGKLQNHVAKQGYANAFFHFGSKKTAQITIDLTLDHHQYHVEFGHNVNDDKLVFEQEFCTDTTSTQQWQVKQDSSESGLTQPNKLNSSLTSILTGSYMSHCRVYHFHDTGATAGFKQATDLNATDFLFDDASNIAAFLYRLKQEYPNNYQDILAAIKAIAPFFHDFYLEPRGESGDQTLILKWIHRDHEQPFSANQLSDGTARFICMATLFLQPQQMLPNTIIIDEPELGLHPAALEVLADIVKSVAKHCQVICSTQSVTFANQFEPADFIVVDQENGASHFRRLKPEDLALWLEDYRMGDIWNKNLVGGRPQW